MFVLSGGDTKYHQLQCFPSDTYQVKSNLSFNEQYHLNTSTDRSYLSRLQYIEQAAVLWFTRDNNNNRIEAFTMPPRKKPSAASPPASNEEVNTDATAMDLNNLAVPEVNDLSLAVMDSLVSCR